MSGVKPELMTEGDRRARPPSLPALSGKSPLIDGLVKAGKIEVGSISGKWESFVIATVNRPLPGVDQALVIAGSDKRGTIYGIYEISEQIGVSPWYWWADVPAQHHDDLFIKAGTYVQGPPAVKYRGIFINDEAPCLGGWAKEKFGGVNSKMYTHMFELILRLRGNYLWPAMWGNAFNEDDPLNPEARRRVRHRHGHLASRADDARPAGMDNASCAVRQRRWNYATNAEGLKSSGPKASSAIRTTRTSSPSACGATATGRCRTPAARKPTRSCWRSIIADQRQISPST